jgi:DNA-binding MarR family transcriptional regulator
MPKRDLIVLASLLERTTLFGVVSDEHDVTMKLFTGLKKLREFERQHLPFLKSVFDFDIVIEIGYAEEQGQPLTLKQLFLLSITSRTTVRRKLATLIDQGIVIRRQHASDHRASFLLISPSTVKLLSKYGGTLAAISVSHFK